MFSSSSTQSTQPTTKRVDLGGGGGGGGFVLPAQDMSGPQDTGPPKPQFEPHELALMRFIIYARMMIHDFVRVSQGDPVIGMVANQFEQMFPNLPPSIDYQNHAEMRYPLSDSQKQSIVTFMKQLYDVMEQPVGQGTVFHLLHNKRPEVWTYLHKEVQLLQFLNVPGRFQKLSQGSQNALYKYVMYLHNEAKIRIGYEKLNQIIPKELEAQCQKMLEENSTPGFGMTPQTATNMMQSMASKEMSQTMSKIFESPDALSTTLKSMGDMMGGAGQEMGQVATTLQNILQNPQFGGMFGSTQPPNSNSSSSSSSSS